MSLLKYILTFFAVALLLLGLAAGFNRLVNPYGMYTGPSVSGFNRVKPELGNHAAMFKAYAVKNIQPQSIILGTSRAERGLDPDHPGWSARPVYNLALSGANEYVIMRYFQHAAAVRPLKQVLLTLDLFSFSTAEKNIPDFAESRLAISPDGPPDTSLPLEDVRSTLFSLDALTSSLTTVRSQGSNPPFLPDGSQNFSQRDLLKYGGHHAYFEATARNFYTLHYHPDDYVFDNVQDPDSPFSYYRQMLDQSYRERIDLRMAISPCHALQWEVLSKAGLWSRWEQWKELLVSINEEEARKYNLPPFPLWDFSGDNEYITESVPGPQDTQASMQWYWDSSHYKKELGDLLLDKVFGSSAPAGSDPTNFGVLIDSLNISQHLADLRSSNQQYHATHPTEITDLEYQIAHGFLGHGSRTTLDSVEN